MYATFFDAWFFHSIPIVSSNWQPRPLKTERPPTRTHTYTQSNIAYVYGKPL